MARPLRIEYDGAWYHVMNRGLERRNIFREPKDYDHFISLLKEITEIFSIEIHAFSLMPNHYHLLIHTPKMGLSRAMRHLSGVYTQCFNKRYKRDGVLFRGRYKACLVDSNEYLTELVRYIHLNPVKAGLCQHPKEHLWTSHLYYLTDCKGYDWLFRDILREYGKTTRVARQNFDLMVRGNLSEEIIQAIEQPKNGIIGGDFFVSWVNENFVESRHKKAKEISRKEKELQSSVTGRDIIENIQHCYDVNLAELRSTIRGQRNEARSLAIYLMRHRLGSSLKTISRWFRVENEYVIAKTLSRFKKDLNEKTCLKRMREIEHAVLRKASP
ncbi:MAG: protein of unknown function DUF1568 [uncultured bacterium]|nr:MAG: protein of unknown function DUF1568 [uncultured bacterium]